MHIKDCRENRDMQITYFWTLLGFLFCILQVHQIKSCTKKVPVVRREIRFIEKVGETVFCSTTQLFVLLLKKVAAYFSIFENAFLAGNRLTENYLW